jgi:hypothetical protein
VKSETYPRCATGWLCNGQIHQRLCRLLRYLAAGFGLLFGCASNPPCQNYVNGGDNYQNGRIVSIQPSEYGLRR